MSGFPCSTLACLTLCALTSASAHHGQEFILLQDYQVPSVWSGSAYSGFEWSHFGGTDESGVETGAMIGIAPRLAFGANVEFSDAQSGWGYSSVTPYLHLQLTPPQSSFPFRVAVQVGYQFAETRDPDPVRVKVITPGRRVVREVKRAPAQSSTPETEPTDGGDGESTPCGPEYGPDAPPCPEPVPAPRSTSHARHTGHTTTPRTTIVTTAPASGGSSSNASTTAGPSTTSYVYLTPEQPKATGIHRHGESFLTARLIMETDLTLEDKLVVNVINVTPESGPPAWGYAAGLRHSFGHEWGLGLEAIGDLGQGEHELVLGAYHTSHSWAVKMGIGVGLSRETADFSVRTGVVLRF
jgi:hypothetical protein